MSPFSAAPEVENHPFSPHCYVRHIIIIYEAYNIISHIGLVDKIEGDIRIDNVNILGVDVAAVRSSISTISQDSLLFSGTLRQNLDPEGEYADHVLTKIIETVDLSEKMNSIDGGLDGIVDARGSNFSQVLNSLVPSSYFSLVLLSSAY